MKKLHAFVAMPFGKKTGPEGTVIGFNAVNKNKLLTPFDEPSFIQKSDLLGGQSRWEGCFKGKPQVQIKAAPIELGEPLKDVNPYERCNLWMFYIALAYGIGKFQFVYLRNGEGDDALGYNARIYHEVNDKTGQIYWLNTRKL